MSELTKRPDWEAVKVVLGETQQGGERLMFLIRQPAVGNLVEHFSDQALCVAGLVRVISYNETIPFIDMPIVAQWLSVKLEEVGYVSSTRFYLDSPWLGENGQVTENEGT